MRLDLRYPLQLAVAIERDLRIRVGIRARPAAAVREVGRAGKRRRVADAPVRQASSSVNRGWVPGAAAAVAAGVSPQVAVLDGVERPLDCTGLLVKCVDDAHAAG